MENIIRGTQSPCINVALSLGDNSQNFRGPYCPNSCKNCHKGKLRCQRDIGKDSCKNCTMKNKVCEIRPKKRPGPKPKKNRPRYSQDRYSSHPPEETGKMLSKTNDPDLLSPQQPRNGNRRASFNGYHQGWGDNMHRSLEARRNSDGGFTNNEAYSDSFPPMFNNGFPCYGSKTSPWINPVTTNDSSPETFYVPNNPLGHTPTISRYSPDISSTISEYSSDISSTISEYSPEISPVISGYSSDISPTISGYSPVISSAISGYSPDISSAISGYSPDISPVISGYSPDISPIISENTPGNPLANTPLIVISSSENNSVDSPYMTDYRMYSPLPSSPVFYRESYDGERNYTDGERNYTDGKRNKEMDFIDGLGITQEYYGNGEHE